MQSIRAGTIYTGRSVATDAFLTFSGNMLAGVSARPRGEVVAECAVITPAFVDPHCHIGMGRAGEPLAEDETNEHMDSLVILADALDSVIMDDAAFAESIEAGVLYSCVVPGSGNVIGGRSAVIRNYAPDTTAALVCRAGLKAALGFNTAVATRSWKGTRPWTRMGAVSLLRKRLDEVRQKAERFRRARGKARDDIVFSAEDGVLRDLLARRERLRVHVHKTDDIACLLRLVDEFGLDVSVEHTGDVYTAGIFRELKRRGIPVVYGPVDGFPYKVELRHEHWRNVAHLLASGVRFGLMSDHPFTLQRNLYLQLRFFVRLGMTKQQAIELVTRGNAELAGLGGRTGTLERGKWASFVCWNGDPFDLTRHPVAVYGEGRRLWAE